MKTISLIIFTVLFGKACNSEADLKNTVLEYTANTRGFYQKIVIKNQTVTVSYDRDGKDNPVAEKIDAADWKALIVEFNKIDLTKLATLKAPTEKRFYDGAAFADLHITYKDSVYECQTFDNGYPPAEIEKFVKLIQSIASPK